LNSTVGRNITRLSDESLKKLENYEWPGNVRELENAMERAYILETASELSAKHLPDAMSSNPKLRPLAVIPDDGIDLEQYVELMQKTYLEEALRRTNRVQVKAAELLRMSYRSFRHYMQKYGIEA
jgi:two-component system response regulator PilR (NtrC family)